MFWLLTPWPKFKRWHTMAHESLLLVCHTDFPGMFTSWFVRICLVLSKCYTWVILSYHFSSPILHSHELINIFSLWWTETGSKINHSTIWDMLCHMCVIEKLNNYLCNKILLTSIKYSYSPFLFVIKDWPQHSICECLFFLELLSYILP